MDGMMISIGYKLKNDKTLKKLYLLLLVALCGAMISPAVAKKKNKKKASTEATTKKEKKETKYDKLFKDKKVTTAKGFITLHKLDNKIYFELPIKVMNRDILLGSTIVETTDNQFGCVGEKSGDPFLIRFVQRDSTITLRRVQAGQFSEDREIKKRLVSSTMPAIAETFEIKAYNNDSTAVVFDMTDYLLSDKKNLSPFSPYSMMEMMGADISKDFEKESSFVQGVKGFEDNVSIRSLLTYKISVGMKGNYAVKKMPFTAVMNRSFILLPEQPMRPRYADSRIGIFEHSVVEFASEGRGLRTRHIAHRWNLEPSDSAAYLRGELVEPKKPIVFYIDDTFPLSWNKYIHKGVEVWQKAFEKIGFKNAIIAKDFPKDDPNFDPENIKYSCIRYAPSTVANAMGPSWIDPRSGEIINASVTVFHNIVQLVQYWRFLQTAPADEEVRDVVLREDLLGDCIAYVLSHEVGHTLSLMHNMAGSSSIPVESLRDPKFTQEFGTTYSIMDYARNNYIAQPGDKERGVRLTPPELGAYDYYAIAWLYTPIFEAKTAEEEIPILRQWISEKLPDPAYRYGRQQIRTRIDPSSFEEDLGDDPVKASSYGVMNLKYILSQMNEWIKDDVEGDFRKEIYNEIIGQYIRYINNVLFNIGGIYVNEHYEGDPFPSYVPVTKEKQRESLKFLWEQALDCSWIDEPALQKILPLHSNLSSVIENLIIDYVLKRFPSVAICGDKMEQNPYTQLDYMDDLYYYMFMVPDKKNVLSEKNMQLKFVSYLMNGIKTVKKGSAAGTSGRMLTDERIPLPEGIVAPTYLYDGPLNHFNDPKEVMGFEDTVSVTIPVESMEHHYYSMLRKIERLAKNRMSAGSDENRTHYRLLVYKISQSLK
mgnify:CR=1 FL=1